MMTGSKYLGAINLELMIQKIRGILMSTANKLQCVASSGCSNAGKRNGSFQFGRTFLWCSALLLPGIALAEAWTVTPELNLRSGYDDNIRIEPDAEINGVEKKANGGIETNASVGLELALLTSISQLRGKARFDFISYAQEEEQDEGSEDNQYIDVVGRYALTSINDIGLRVGLERKFTGTNSRNFLEGYAEGSLDVDDPGDTNLSNVDTDIGVSRQQVRRERLQAEPYWSVGLTQNTRLRLQYRYDDTTYGSGAFDARLVDYTIHNGSVRLEHSLTETSNVFVSVDARTFEPARGRSNDELAARFGYRYNFSPISVVGFILGARRLTFDSFDTGSVEIEEDDDTGAIMRVYGEHRGELARYTASIGHTLTPSGTGALVESNIAEFNISRSLSPRFEFRFESEYFGNAAVGDSENFGDPDVGNVSDRRSDRDYVRLSPMLRWNWTPEWAVNLIYEYEWEDREINKDRDEGQLSGDGNSADSNGIFISIVYRKDNEIGQKN